VSQIEPQGPKSSFRTVLVAAAAVVFAVLLLAGYDGSRDLARLKARESQLEARLRHTEGNIAELKDRIGRLRSDPYTLERAAREELGLVRPGEVVVILPRAGVPADPEEPTSSATP
jgi:cell division protein FtsB